MAFWRGSAVATIVVLTLASGLALAAGSPVLAQVQPPDGTFACRASAVNLLGVEPVVANAAGVPCTDVSRSLLDLPGTSPALLASARTQPAPAGGGAMSQAQVVGVDVALLGLRADSAEARATLTCQAGRPQLTGTSTVVGLTVNGQAVPADAPAELSLVVGTLRLKHTATVGNTLVQRAVWLETALGSVVLGEAQVGFTGSPCVADPVPREGSITVVQDSQPNSRQNFTFTGDLGRFTLRDDGRSSGADRRTFPVAPGQYRVSELRPTGGPVQQAWNLQDVSCTDVDGGTVIERDRGTVLVDVDSGQHIVCTFRNFNGILAATGGDDIDNPTTGLEPPVVKIGVDTTPRTTAPAQIVPPPPPTTVAPPPPVDSGGSTLTASTGLIAVPLVAVLGGLLWFLLVAARRRREEEPA